MSKSHAQDAVEEPLIHNNIKRAVCTLETSDVAQRLHQSLLQEHNVLLPGSLNVYY